MKKKNQIFTIPNLLSLLRLAMIPLLLYALIIDRIVPWLFSAVLTVLCGGMMVLSMVMYGKRNWNSIRNKAGGSP